jgi:hypothetical protein
MTNAQRVGGVAALYEAIAWLIGLARYVLAAGTMDAVDPVERGASLEENQAFLYTLDPIIA